MSPILPVLLCSAMLALSACSAADRSADSSGAAAGPAAAPAPAATAPPAPTPTPAPTANASAAQAGWYMEHGDMGMFQPCGQDKSLTVDSAELRQRAKDFELEPNTPVYVRLSGTSDGSTFTVTGVDQFGSPVPVKDCSMTGTVTQ
jgi:pyruvate/2-oxoglutarate dehydrogenase complex dihydrolipoamide acyltransferase (E2) component